MSYCELTYNCITLQCIMPLMFGSVSIQNIQNIAQTYPIISQHSKAWSNFKAWNPGLQHCNMLNPAFAYFHQVGRATLLSSKAHPLARPNFMGFCLSTNRATVGRDWNQATMPLNVWRWVQHSGVLFVWKAVKTSLTLTVLKFRHTLHTRKSAGKQAGEQAYARNGMLPDVLKKVKQSPTSSSTLATLH